MKILYDGQIFESQKIGGISRLFSELMRRLSSFKNIAINFPISVSENIYIRNVDFFKRVRKPKVSFGNFLPWFGFPGKGRIYRYFYLRENKRCVIKNLKKGNFDIFHPTYYDPYFLRYIGKKPFVLTVYDMTHELYAKDMPRFDFSAKNKKKLSDRASKIIAISENTKKDLIKFHNIPEEKIEVVYLANSLTPVKGKPAGTPQLPKKYVFFVGGRGSYKNFNLLVESIAPLLKKDKKLFLVCAGHGFSKKEKQMFGKLGIENKVKSYLVNDSVLSYLYQNAICFVFPSLYEGFGFPTLEAFSCGCPAILSSSSCMPEVGGEAAVYFDSKDSKDILKKVSNIISSEKVRKDMIKKGYAQLKKFSWEKCAKETKKIYEDVLN